MKIPDGWITRIEPVITWDYPSEVANLTARVHLRDHGPLRVYHNILLCACERAWECANYEWAVWWKRDRAAAF